MNSSHTGSSNCKCYVLSTGVKILRTCRTRDEGQGLEVRIQEEKMDFCEHTGGEQRGVYLNNKSASASDFQSYHYILS